MSQAIKFIVLILLLPNCDCLAQISIDRNAFESRIQEGMTSQDSSYYADILKQHDEASSQSEKFYISLIDTITSGHLPIDLARKIAEMVVPDSWFMAEQLAENITYYQPCMTVDPSIGKEMPILYAVLRDPNYYFIFIDYLLEGGTLADCNFLTPHRNSGVIIDLDTSSVTLNFDHSKAVARAIYGMILEVDRIELFKQLQSTTSDTCVEKNLGVILNNKR